MCGRLGVGPGPSGATALSCTWMYRMMVSNRSSPSSSVYQQLLAAAIDPTAPAMEQLRAGADCFFAMLEDDPGRWRLLFGSNAVLPGQ